MCELCWHPYSEHVLGMGLIGEVPTYRYSCAHIEDGQVCDCMIERQEVIEVETEQ